MDIGQKYSTSLYEVLDESTQKYSSTSVSGGSGYVSGSNGTTYGNSSPVTSTTHYHSDQGVWVRNLDTGSERKFQFNSFNVDVRPGHKILCAWNDETEKMERLINISTDTVYAAGGDYNDWTKNGKILSAPKGIFWTSLLKFSWWASIPFLCVFNALKAFFSYFITGKGPFWKEKAKGIKKYGALLLVLDVFLFFWALNIADQYTVRAEDWITYMFVAIISFTILHMKIIKAEFKVVKAHSDALDAYLVAYVADNKSKIID